MAFILHEPLLAFSGITPKEDDPLLDIIKLYRTVNLRINITIPEGNALQTLGLHPLGFY